MEPQCQTPLGTVRTESRRHNPYAPATPVQGAPHSSSTQQATRARTLASPLSVVPHAHPTTQARSLADSGAPLPAPPPAMVLTVGKGDIQKTFLVTNDAQVLAPSATGGASHTQLTKEVVARPALSLAPHAVTPPRVLFKDESPAARSHAGTDSATTPSHSLTQHPIEVDKKSSHGGHSGTVGSDESSDDDYDVALEGPKDEDHLRRAQLFLLAAPRLALSFPDDLLDPAHTLKPGRTVAARQKQIQHGYSRPEYQRYLEQVPKANRQPGNKNHPFTPRANYKSARRRFKALCRAWRVCLHVWGLPEMDAHKAAMHSESPGPQPADQDSPQVNEELHVLDPNLDPEILSTPKSNRHAEVSGADDGSRTTPVSQLCIPQSFGSKLPTPNTAVPLHRPTPLKPKLSPRSESPSSSPPERLFGSRSHE